MKLSLTPKTWSSRARLTAAIAITLAVGGTLLLVTQYVLFSALLNQEVSETWTQPIEVGEIPPGSEHGEPEITRSGPVWTSSEEIVSQVLRSGLGWSALLLGVFIAVAVCWASFLSRRSLRRISRLTEAASAITEHDLSQRLALTGPADEITGLGDTIDSMIERLEQAFTRQERFIANASHELRTPLATVRTALQVPLRQGRVPDDLRAEVENAIGANRRMEQLIQALLAVARGQDAEEMDFEAVDLGALAEELVAESGADAQQRGVTLTLEMSESARVHGNPALLRALTANLVRNGIIHNSPAGGSCSVSVVAEDGLASLRVENTGAEYAADIVDRLTEPFYRGDASRLSGPDGASAGMGLGLTLARGIVELHGGLLAVEARNGGGLIVTARLPRSM